VLEPRCDERLADEPIFGRAAALEQLFEGDRPPEAIILANEDPANAPVRDFARDEVALAVDERQA
jgi:hypothetical protein